jgi:membrane protease YdiL (CAAX protease family)
MTHDPQHRNETRRRVAIAAAALPIVAVGLLNALYLPHLAGTPVAYWSADIAQWLVLSALCLYALARYGAVAPREYGLRAPTPDFPARQMLGASVLASLLLAGAYFGTTALAERWLPATPPAFSYSGLVPSGAMRVPVVIYFAVTAGFVEEVVYRGLPLTALGSARRLRGARGAYVLATALLFASIHWEGGPAHLAPAFAAGVAAALLYLHIGNLWPLVVAHTVVNLIDFW